MCDGWRSECCIEVNICEVESFGEGLYDDEIRVFDSKLCKGGIFRSKVDICFVDNYDVVLGWVGEDLLDVCFGDEGFGGVVW